LCWDNALRVNDSTLDLCSAGRLLALNFWSAVAKSQDQLSAGAQ